MATAKKVVEVKEVVSDESIYGYLGGAVKYTPKVFKTMKMEVTITALTTKFSSWTSLRMRTTRSL